ncbi:unnamed protein product, partial [Rotaria sordida]
MIDEWNTKIETIPERTLIGAVYVPPGKSPPLHLFSKYRNKPFFIFGDFNAKHSSWDCEINNNSGNQIASCLWDRSSIYKSARTYRPPWPPSLVFLAQQ